MANNKDFVVKNAVEVGGPVTSTVGTITSDVQQTSYDIANASYDSKSFSVASEETSPHGIAFKSDGTKMYVSGNSDDDISQYSLSTAWDVSTASFDSVTFSLGTPGTVFPAGLIFKPDGTKMYVPFGSIAEVREYDLSTAWDLSTASYSSVLLDASTEMIIPSGLYFKSDGLTLFILDNNSDDVNEYTLTTAWDLSTASFASNTFSVETEDNLVYGLWFNDDGTKFIVAGDQNDLAYEYSMTTAWDITTASYSSTSFNLASAGSTSGPRGITFKPDGSKMYSAMIGDDTIYQYSTASYADQINLDTGNCFNDTLSENTTYTFSNAGDVQSFQLEVSGPPALSGDIFFFGADAGNSSNYADADTWTTTIDIANQGAVDTNFYLTRQTVSADGTYTISFSTANASSAVSGGLFLYKGGTYVGQNRGSGTVSFGSGLTIGESVLFLIESNEDSTETYAPPTGYTKLFENTSSETTATATVVSYKIADATSESTAGGTWSGTSDVYRALIHVRNTGVAASASDIFSDAKPFTALGSSYSTNGNLTPEVITWPTSIEWSGGEAPSTPTAGGVDILSFITTDGGTSYLGTRAAANLS